MCLSGSYFLHEGRICQLSFTIGSGDDESGESDAPSQEPAESMFLERKVGHNYPGHLILIPVDQSSSRYSSPARGSPSAGKPRHRSRSSTRDRRRSKSRRRSRSRSRSRRRSSSKAKHARHRRSYSREERHNDHGMMLRNSFFV